MHDKDSRLLAEAYDSIKVLEEGPLTVAAGQAITAADDTEEYKGLHAFDSERRIGEFAPKPAFEAIAKQKLGIPTLHDRNMDRLDFHEVSVRGLHDALEAAFELGKKHAHTAYKGQTPVQGRIVGKAGDRVDIDKPRRY